MQIEKKKITEIEKKEVFNIVFTNNNNFTVGFYNFGGYIDKILVPLFGKNNLREDILLGYNNFKDFLSDKSYLNCIIGRVCGRIKNSKFVLKNNQYNLYANDGKNHLHGGNIGFNKKIWTIENLNQTSNYLSCDLVYRSVHLDEGYPGNLECKVNYSLNNNNEFKIEFKAESDQDTIINLTNHNYWNFHGHGKLYNNILHHKVKINSRKYFQNDKELIHTHQVLNTNNTKYNFFNFKYIDSIVLNNNGIDILYIVEDYNEKVIEIASCYSDISGIGMKLFSNQPAMQYYTGNMMNFSYNGKMDRRYGYQYGMCFEPQLFPFSFNKFDNKSPTLFKGQKYHSIITMKLLNNFPN